MQSKFGFGILTLAVFLVVEGCGFKENNASTAGEILCKNRLRLEITAHESHAVCRSALIKGFLDHIHGFAVVHKQVRQEETHQDAQRNREQIVDYFCEGL